MVIYSTTLVLFVLHVITSNKNLNLVINENTQIIRKTKIYSITVWVKFSSSFEK